jgi:twitching motility two-component system response regulator PilH
MCLASTIEMTAATASVVTELKKRILVVDDSEELRELFRVVLAEAGYDVITAASGEEAFEKTRASRPDLILLDLIMPGMDGFQFLTRIRSDLAPPIPPTILCTGFDLTEEEALRRGALMFVRKPVMPSDLLEFVAQGLLGEQVGPATAARERANSAAARKLVRETATTLVGQLRRRVEERGSGQMEWLAAYFGLETAVASLMDQGRLTVVAAAGDPSFEVGLDLARKLAPCYEILDSRSSLVLSDASAHSCFSSGPYRLEGVRFFAGVPLLAPEGDPIGVICLLDSHARRTPAEDLIILEQVGRRGSLLLRLLALGRPDSELPGRLGPGMMERSTLDVLVDAELRLLRESGGTMELAIVEVDDPERVRELVLHARDRERLGAGALGPTRVAVYKRDRAGGAAAQIHELLSALEATKHLRGVGAAWIGGADLPALGGQDLMRLAELALKQAIDSGGGSQRLVLQHEVTAGDASPA